MKNSQNESVEQYSQNPNSEENTFTFPSNKSDIHCKDKYHYNENDFDINEAQDNFNKSRKRRPSSSNLDLKESDLASLQSPLLLQKTVSINNDFFNKKQNEKNVMNNHDRNSVNQNEQKIKEKETKKPKLRKKIKLRKVIKGQRDPRSKQNNYYTQKSSKYESQSRYQKKNVKSRKGQFQTWKDDEQSDKIYPLKKNTDKDQQEKYGYKKKKDFSEQNQSNSRNGYRKKNKKQHHSKVKMKGFFELSEEFRKELKENDKEKMIHQDLYLYICTELWKKFGFVLDYLKQQAQMREKGRRIMKERLDLIVRKTLENKFHVQEYGSASTQLLTPFSDLDLQIKSKNPRLQLDKQTAIQVLQTIYENLQLEECSFIISSKAILSAKMPVLKVLADANKKYLDTDTTDQYEEVKIDLTVDLKDSFYMPNTSSKTTNFTKEQIEKYPVFFDCVLLVKFILSCIGLNETYTGGLNSYGLCLLFVAFLEANNLEQSKDHGQVFFQFLEFYGRKFNFEKQQVNLGLLLINKKQPFVNKQQNDASLYIYDPCAYVEKNVTPNCYQIKYIFSIFDKTIQQVEKYQQTIYNAIQENLYVITVEQLIEQIDKILPTEKNLLKEIFDFSFNFAQVIFKKVFKKFQIFL